MIVNSPVGMEVKARRALGDGEKFQELIDGLRAGMEKAAEEDKPLLIADLDLSQNSLTTDQFEELFAVLGENNCRVKHFRLFGCPTLNDEVMRMFGDYFRLLPGPESAPTEMHLSDCAITAEGWGYFISAIEETELYPLPALHERGKPAPLYLRLENNYIEDGVIQEKVDEGIVRPFTKGGRPAGVDTVKVDLMVRQLNGTFAQKSGDPPPPEEAGPPKRVHDKFEDQQRRQQEMSRGGGFARTPSNGAPGRAAPWNSPGAAGYAPPAPGITRPGAFRPGAVRGGALPAPPMPQRGTANFSRGVLPPAPLASRPGHPAPALRNPTASRFTPTPRATPSAGPTPVAARGGGGAGGAVFNAFGGGGGRAAPSAGRGVSGGAQDRSRTPANRGQPPAKAPQNTKKAAAKLPYPWEEHWSDEFKIPYFWNSLTGDSAWERPRA